MAAMSNKDIPGAEAQAYNDEIPVKLCQFDGDPRPAPPPGWPRAGKGRDSGTLAGASTQAQAGASTHGTGQGTARTPESPGYFAWFDAFSGTSTGTSARGTARTRFSSDLNRGL
jgi:hypothetical protein